MILYVDETENENVFIVAGLLVQTEEEVMVAYKRFKNNIKGFKLGDKAKSKLFTEFKSTLMDRKYQRIKVRMLKEISGMDCLVYYSVYEKSTVKMKQPVKQSVYISLLTRIVSSIKPNMVVIFDNFGIDSFENDIIHAVGMIEQVKMISAADSQIEPGLQFVDNICSVIRRHICSEEGDLFFEYISDRIKPV